MRRTVSILTLLLVGIGPAVAHGSMSYHRTTETLVVVSHPRQAISRHVMHEPAAPRTACETYKHAIWIAGEPKVRDRVVCIWPDGTLRDGPRPY